MNLENFKSGIYEQQYKFKSFLPTLINHEWQISDPEVLSLLSDTDRLMGELNAFSQLIPNVDFFISMHIAKEAIQSSRIEGTRTNMEEAFLNEHDVAPERKDDWEEVQNYIRAINDAIKQLTDLPLSNRLLRNAHRILMQGVRGEHKQPGEFRASQNWIGPSLRHAVFVPPHVSKVEELMSDLEKFIHNEEIQVPHLIKIAIAHYQFETIHPFLDGNGRLGRLMIALYLADNGLLHKPALYLSDYFERNKTQYIDRLMAVRQSNQLREWLVFFLVGVQETAKSSIDVFKDVLELKETLEREVLPRFSAQRQNNVLALMELLYRLPVVNIKAVKESLGVSTNTASALVNDFIKFGILEKFSDNSRNRIFWFRRYIELFSDERSEY